MNRRLVNSLPVITTFLVLGCILLLLLRGSQQATADGVTTDSGGRVALIGILFASVVPAFISRVDIHIPRWIPWAVGALSLLLTTVLWSLVASGRDALAWAAYGGLQVLRAPVNFNDLNWPLRWLDCGQCSSEQVQFGPALTWLEPATGGLVNASWTTPLGFLLALVMVLVLVVLIRRSNGRGALVLLLAAVGPAWLLQQDRANTDGLVFLVIVLGAWLVARRDTLVSWSGLAVAIWLFGALKFYPLAIGLVLLLALRLRRGWLVLLGFTAASAALMALSWQEFQASSAWNALRNTVVFDFPAYGRVMVTARMGSLSGEGWLTPGSALFLALAVAAGWWGWSWARTLRSQSLTQPVMAIGGSTVFLAAILIGGFGYMYKGIFLLPLIPLLALPRGSRPGRLALYTSLFATVLIALAVTLAYSSVLTTLAGVTAASLGLGAGLYEVVRLLRSAQPIGKGDHSAPSARSSQVSTAAS